jgi:DNA-binding CsgD family transcriptional regulator
VRWRCSPTSPSLANDEIAARLSVSQSTVKTHLHRLMTKLNLRSRARAVVYAFETGIARVGDGADGPGGPQG